MGWSNARVCLRANARLLAALLVLAFPTAARAGYEVDVSKDAAVRDGEPSLGLNPTDPSNLVVGHMKVGRGECAASASFDGGATWTSQVLGDITDPVYSFCADPTLTFGPDGTVYLAAIAFNRSFELGHTVVTSSSDGGRHWSRPVEAIGGGTPPADGFDRPWLAVDGSSGALYLTTMTIFSRPMGPFSHRYLVVSHDKGEHWGKARTVDSSRYPADHWATGTIGAGPGGALAIAYTARAVPEPGRRCPCVVVASTRDGVAFQRHTLPFGDAMLGVAAPERGSLSALRLLYGPTVAADPTRPGGYAVAVAGWKGIAPFFLGRSGLGPPNDVQVELFLTRDSGRSWKGPTVLGEERSKDREHVWLAYSPGGALGVIWRTHSGACCFGSTNVWSAISRDGGSTFDGPRQLSHASSPFTGGLGDDYQSVVLDRSSLHAAWADGRSGDDDIYYGRLPVDGG